MSHKSREYMHVCVCAREPAPCPSADRDEAGRGGARANMESVERGCLCDTLCPPLDGIMYVRCVAARRWRDLLFVVEMSEV